MEQIVFMARAFISWLPAGLVLLTILATPFLSLTAPVVGGQGAVVYPMRWDHADVVRAAATAQTGLLRFGALPNIAIVQIDSTDTLEALKQSGAWLVLPPGALGGCLVGREDTFLIQDANISSVETSL